MSARQVLSRAGRAFCSSLRSDSGQMTVELMVVLPVVIVIAVIAVNALTFFSTCAEFDRVGRNAVRVCAASPAYGQELSQSAALVETAVSDELDLPNADVSVSVRQDALGHAAFDLALSYRPTLFGLGLKDEVFGVSLPALRHTTCLVIDVYKPGMLL